MRSLIVVLSLFTLSACDPSDVESELGDDVEIEFRSELCIGCLSVPGGLVVKKGGEDPFDRQLEDVEIHKFASYEVHSEVCEIACDEAEMTFVPPRQFAWEDYAISDVVRGGPSGADWEVDVYSPEEIICTCG